MSRKYCEVCREPHRNDVEGLCDKHLAEAEAAKIEAHNAEVDRWDSFMELSEEERWEKVFEFMRAQGWEQ